MPAIATAHRSETVMGATRMFQASMPSPLGFLLITADPESIRAIAFAGNKQHRAPVSVDLPSHLRACMAQLKEYFSGARRAFTLPLGTAGTAFQQSVWKAMMNIPYGRTVTYRAIADAIGSPVSVRAVGVACGANPIPIVIPCHRIVASGGLGGYAGTLSRKRWLLRHEGPASS